MPKKPDGEPYKQLPKGYSKQVGSSLSYWTSTAIYGFFGHPEYLRLAEYERAKDTDETIGAGIEFIKLSIIASLGSYVHPNPKIQDFVQEALDRMEGNHKSAIGELADSAIWSGFGVSEVVYKAEDGKIWINYIANYNPRTITFYVNDKGRLTEGEKAAFNNAFTTGIWQDRLGSTPVRLPLNRCCLVTHNKRHSNYYGQSSIKRIYKNWRLKEAVLEMWNVALDRYGTPVVYSIVPNGYTGRQLTDPTAPGGVRNETIADSTESAIANIHTGTGLVIERPGPTDPIELGTLTTGNNFGDSFIQAIQYYNKAMYRGFLIPHLLLNEQESGSLGSGSASQVHFDVYSNMLSALYSEIVEPFVEQVIGRLVKINFGDSNPGKFESRPWDPTTKELMGNLFEQMIVNGIINNSDINDINLVRIMCGVDPLDEKRARVLAKKNSAALIGPEHMENTPMTISTTTKSESKADSSGGQASPNAAKSGGAPGSAKPGGAPSANKQSPNKPGASAPTSNKQAQKQDVKTQQIVKAPVPKPPGPILNKPKK